MEEQPPPPPRPAPGPDDGEIEVPALTFANGTGGFADGGREYVVVLDGTRRRRSPGSTSWPTPASAPWSRPRDRRITWAENSRENRLTPFANDPVTDPTAEALFLRDEDGGDVWSPTPGPMRRTPESGRFVTRHAAGVSRFTHASHGILQELAVFVDAKDPVKFSLLTLTNRTGRPRRLSVFAYNEWCLGPPQPGERPARGDGVRRGDGGRPGDEPLQPGVRRPGRLRPRQRGAELGDRRPARVPGPQRLAWRGRPPCVTTALSGQFGAGLDPCAALQVEHQPGPGRESPPRLHPGTGQGSRARARAGAPPWQRGRRGPRPRERCGSSGPTPWRPSRCTPRTTPSISS